MIEKLKKLEEENLAAALVAKKQGEYEAAKFESKTKDILSQPKMIQLMEVENQRLMWEGFLKHGKSPFGEHNIYGTTPSILMNR